MKNHIATGSGAGIVSLPHGVVEQSLNAAAQLNAVTEPFPGPQPDPFPPTLPDPKPPGVAIYKVKPAGIKPHPDALNAQKAIAAKAAEPQVAAFAGVPQGDPGIVAGGWVQHYQGCDIYYSVRTRAHEVHGEIKAKYDALMGPNGRLGFPTTDEQGSPDGVGRYNYFEQGAIFWTSHTGPMMMGRAIVDAWISNGAQNELGYPVIDQYRYRLIHQNFTVGAAEAIEWVKFERGAIVQMPDGVLQALPGRMAPDKLRRFIRSTFDKGFHATGYNVGLQPDIDDEGVSDWQWGFWASAPPGVSVGLHGFHDNGVLLPDTNFTLHARLSFDLVSQQAGLGGTAKYPIEPLQKTLVARLTYIRVEDDGGFYEYLIPPVGGLVAGAFVPSIFVSAAISAGVGSVIANAVKEGVLKAFFPDQWPDPKNPEVPYGSMFVQRIPVRNNQSAIGAINSVDNLNESETVDVLDVLVTPAGEMQILVNPLPSGPFDVGAARQAAAQQALDAINV